MRKRLFAPGLYAFLVFGALGLFGLVGAPDAAAQTAPAAVGVDTCLKCHTDAKAGPILQTPHAVKGDRHTPFAQNGCESCHGASAEHVAARKNLPSVIYKGPNVSPVAVRNQQCLTCHQTGMRMNWTGSQHQSNEVACASCHTVHVAKDPVLQKATQAEKCFTCHATQRAQANRFSHHPIKEGKVTCSDCHNPHGGRGPSLLKEVTINGVCYNCHAEKRGPMVREHPPVRENCMNCHTPHGSAQPRLLTERPPYLCQNCHDGTFHPGQPFSGQNVQNKTFTLGSSTSITTRFQMIGRSCLNCHSQVHGSNTPGGVYNLR